MRVRGTLLLLILLVAFGLRVVALTAVPPGLTHDEANHGREAIGILGGDLRFYFPLNYGSEPLYSYTVAASMALVGQNLFGLRLVSVLFGVLTCALLYQWVRRQYGGELALLTVALTAVAYWSLVTSRMALRATLLPFFLLLAIYAFWRILDHARHSTAPSSGSSGYTSSRWIGDALLFAVPLALTLHIYLAARLTWLIFPLFLVYLWWRERETFAHAWRPVLAGLLLTGLFVSPMFLYLSQVPEAETRLEMLDGTLAQTRQGNLAPLFNNSREALLGLVWPGYGDQFLAYNIPGRPLFEPLTALLFVVGLAVAGWRWREPRYAFLLLWLGVGLLPSLITGATANSTRNIGALPLLYLLPAVGMGQMMAWGRAWRVETRPWLWVGAAVWISLVGGLTVRDYFGHWANMPEVRGAYQTSMVAALNYANKMLPPTAPTLFSTVYPGAAHDSSLGLVLLNEKERPQRWLDGRLGLVAPRDTAVPLLVPASTPLHPHFRPWMSQIDYLPLRPDDLDPAVTVYQFRPPPVPTASLANFNEGVALLTAAWLAETVSPGGVAELLTVWQVLDPGRMGPIVPPLETTDGVLFTHVLRADGSILTQADVASAPTWSWQAGDVVWQVHQLWIAPDTAVGEYQAIVGLYDRWSGARLPNVVGGDTTAVAPLIVSEFTD